MQFLAVWIGVVAGHSTLLLETEMVELVNEERAKRKLPELEHSEELSKVARKHSEEMARLGRISHRSPTTGLPRDRLIKAGYACVASGENVAKNVSVELAMRQLMKSEGHRKNILSVEYTHIGVGVVKGEDGTLYITQLFARPVKRMEPSEAVQELFSRVNELRKRRRLKPLILDVRLARLAGSALDAKEPEKKLESLIRSARGSYRKITYAIVSSDGLERVLKLGEFFDADYRLMGADAKRSDEEESFGLLLFVVLLAR